jgi:IPT/TIG domain
MEARGPPARRVKMYAMRSDWVSLCLCAGLLGGCGNPQPKLTAVVPGQAYDNADVLLTLLGDGFVPASIVDPSSGARIGTADGFHARIGKGSRWVDLGGLDWHSTSHLSVMLPSARNLGAQSLPTGSLDVELTDPRGKSAQLPDAFVNLGPDQRAPTVVFTAPEPSAVYAAGMLLSGSFHASDTAPGLLLAADWSYFERGQRQASGPCYFAPGATQADCTFQVTINPGLGAGEVVEIRAVATDEAGNQGGESLLVTLAVRPTAVSISPERGGTGGGTDVIIKGTRLTAGCKALLDGVPIFPDGGIVVDDQTISGHVPAHDPGETALAVLTPLGVAIGAPVFTYVAPPLISGIKPNAGSPAGGTSVSITGQHFTQATQIYFGNSLDSARPLSEFSLLDDTSVIGRAPPGNGPTTVWAFDASLGFTQLTNGFTWRTP